MSTYLVAFIVSDFDFKEKIDANSISHRVYAHAQTIMDNKFTFALDQSDKLLTALSNYLERNYTLPKIDHAEIPDYPAFDTYYFLLKTFYMDL